MNSSSVIKFIAACAGFAWATASFSQHSGHTNAPAAKAQSGSPDAGEQNRAIRSLSENENENEIEGLRSGAGMAYAKAAELNGYPGPSHVLELAGQLQLDDQQRQATRRLIEQHKTRAREQGIRLVEAERQLDIAFASKKVDARVADDLTRQIGLLQARLRAEHLQTHLTQTTFMTPRQIAGYQRLSGYDPSSIR
jgi:Spy/CpxP family protein refolding chaperone